MQTDHHMARMSKPDHHVWVEPHGEFGPEVRCICGWMKRHARAKVRDKAAAAHLAAKGVAS